MKKYIAVFTVEDDCNILTMDAEVKYTYETNGTNYVMREDIEFIRAEESEPKTRKWKRTTDKTGHLVWECDCGWQQRFNTNFCPDCGAEMEK